MFRHAVHRRGRANAIYAQSQTPLYIFSFYESSLAMTPVSMQTFLHHENNFIPDRRLFSKRKRPKTGSLWLFVSVNLARCQPPLLLPSGCHFSSAPPLHHLPFPVSFLLSCLPSLLRFHHCHHPLCLPTSGSLWLLCLALSRTHVGLIELEDPALIKGRVRLNASKPLRLQPRAG